MWACRVESGDKATGATSRATCFTTRLPTYELLPRAGQAACHFEHIESEVDSLPSRPVTTSSMRIMSNSERSADADRCGSATAILQVLQLVAWRYGIALGVPSSYNGS